MRENGGRAKGPTLVIVGCALAAVGSVTGVAEGQVAPPPSFGDEPYCTNNLTDVKECILPLPGRLLAGELDCLTGADSPGPARRGVLPRASRLSKPLLPGPYAIVAPLNQRFGVLTTVGALAFKPAFPRGGEVVTLPTDRGVSISFLKGVTRAGRYRWSLPLERGQRVKRRSGRLLVTDVDGRAILRIALRGNKTGAASQSRANSGAVLAQSEDPPDAGSDADGFYVDYPEGGDHEALSVVPIGDPSPFDCRTAQTPEGQQDAPPSSDGVNVDLVFQDDGIPARVSRRGPPARASLVVCPGFLSNPFKAGVIPGSSATCTRVRHSSARRALGLLSR